MSFTPLFAIFCGCSVPSPHRISGAQTPFTGNAVLVLWTKVPKWTRWKNRGKGQVFSVPFSSLSDYLCDMVIDKYSSSRRRERNHIEIPLQDNTTNILTDLDNNIKETVTVAGSSMHLSDVAHLPWERIKTYRPERQEALHQRLW